MSRNFPHFMKHDVSLVSPPEPATYPCPEPDYSNPRSPHTLSFRSDLSLGLTSGFFPSDFPTKILHAFLFTPKRVKFPTHLILLEVFSRRIFGEEFINVYTVYKLYKIQSIISYNRRKIEAAEMKLL
jgi:hypothetical protein